MMTSKQKATYEAIKYFIEQNGYSPTYEELAKMLRNNTPSTVFKKVMALEKKGYIATNYGRNRTIRIIKEVNI